MTQPHPQPIDPALFEIICAKEWFEKYGASMMPGYFEARISAYKRIEKERIKAATHTHAAQAPDTLGELKITQEMLYEFCEWFCDHNVDCSEAPCNISVSRLHERLEGIMKQMKDHPEYLAKWDVKRAEQESLRGSGAP